MTGVNKELSQDFFNLCEKYKDEMRFDEFLFQVVQMGAFVAIVLSSSPGEVARELLSAFESALCALKEEANANN